MGIRQRIAQFFDSSLIDPAAVAEMVKAEVKQARMSLPMTGNYDIAGDGYRRLTGEAAARDLEPLSQDRMLEIAYWMMDVSGLTKRFASDIKNFILGEGVTIEVENDPDGKAQEIIDQFWNDSINAMNLRMPSRVEYLFALGEQCWPVSVNPANGFVRLSYIDPSNIGKVHMVPGYPEIHARVDMKATAGRDKGRQLSVIREELDPRNPAYGRLVGDCFFLAINRPPNGARGRSEFLAQFDYINNYEEGLFDYQDRIRQMLTYVWDVTLQGADDTTIREFLQANSAPKPGSVRAHNEQVTWQAVAPSINAADQKSQFDMIRTYLAGCNNRPDSWYGAGGKVYGSEAESQGQPTYKDIASKQMYVKHAYETVLKFVLDQAILHKTLRDGAYKANVDMPEASTRDAVSIGNGLVALAAGLGSAEQNNWITSMDAAQTFVAQASRLGTEMTVNEALEKIQEAKALGLTDDYIAKPKPPVNDQVQDEKTDNQPPEGPG